jgi:tetratricopeptide (TPR) repeat protein
MVPIKAAAARIAGTALLAMLPLLFLALLRPVAGSANEAKLLDAWHALPRAPLHQPNAAPVPFHKVAQDVAGKSVARVALVMGNSNYPGDDRPLAQPVKDARALAEELRRAGFDVIVAEDLTRQKMRAAIEDFEAKIKPGSAALIFFSGYGIQAGRQSYMIPVDAQIWTEGEVRRDGTRIESVLAEMNSRGAVVKLIIIDAARRNPFERRFRSHSAGLASLDAPAGTLAMYSAAPEKVENDTDGENSLFVGELLKEMRTPGQSAEQIFSRTRIGVSRASNNDQVPWVSSSLVDDFYFSKQTAAVSPPALPQVEPPAPPKISPPPQVSPPPVAPPPQVSPAPPPLPSTPRPPQPAPAPQIATPQPPPPAVKPEASQTKNPLIEQLDEILRRNPNNANAYYKRGQAYAERGNYAPAAEDFGQAIRLNPKDAEALNNRCFIRAVLGQVMAALLDCDEAVRLSPDYADAFDSRGLVHLKLGQFDQAIADYDAALRLNSKLASSLYGRGRAKIRKGDSIGGNADLAAAKAMNPDIADDFAGYGVQ